MLKEAGSFFVNGEVVQTDNPGGGNPSGRIVVNQMYVEYAIPQKQKAVAWPVIMVHGSGHTGKTYDTMPDGRDGWKQHFLRKGYSVYVVEQVVRARSGWNTAPINNAETKGDAKLIPKGGIVQFTYERAWSIFRFGPKPDEWWPDSKFPKDHFMAQLIPNTEATLPQPPRKSVDALIALMEKIGPSILMVHSQSGVYGALTAVARPDLESVQDINRFLELSHVHDAERTGRISYPACRRANSGKAAKSRRAMPRKRVGFIAMGYTTIRMCLQVPRTLNV